MGRFQLTKTQQMGVAAAMDTRRQIRARLEGAHALHMAPLLADSDAATKAFTLLVHACADEVEAKPPEGVQLVVQTDEKTGELTGYVVWEVPPAEPPPPPGAAPAGYVKPEPPAKAKPAKKPPAKKKAKKKRSRKK